ncbi:FAD-dependent oxidoreductase [Nesterenkonia sp. F]|uniref:FAD-dependent oxidoreductase n=1 Tax=Nesterenkonia sp. F TaxID=795955 RepID=UPI000255D1FF|nr:FAD-dependent oxidoreductase [Nesterenkonia sp. F]
MGVTVVGAGLVGLLTAWRLRREGHAVTLVAPDVGGDASYAAAGMLAPISEVQYGQDRLYPIMTASRAEYPDLLAELARAVDAPTGWRENGTVLLAADRSDRDAVADLVGVQQAHGMEVEPMTSSRLRRREPALAPGVSKGWDVPSDHQVDPRLLTAALAEALAAPLDPAAFPEAGPAAQQVRGTVVRLERDGAHDGAHDGTDDDRRQYRLTLASGEELVDERVVLAPGLGYGRIEGIPRRHPLPLRPVHGDVLRLRVHPGRLAPGEEHLVTATIRAKVRGRSVYLVPRGDGGLVVGASSREDGLAGTRAGSVQELLDDAAAILPAVKDMELEEIATRARPGTPDDIPLLGLLDDEPGVVVSTGYSRHGILLAPIGARLAAALVGPPTPDAGRAVDAELSAADAQLLASMDPTRATPDDPSGDPSDDHAVGVPGACGEPAAAGMSPDPTPVPPTPAQKG